MKKNVENNAKRHIAVITSAPTVKNYGAYLQAYATQRLLENYGFDVKLVVYSRNTLDEAATIKEIEYGLRTRTLFNKMPRIFRYLSAMALYQSVQHCCRSFSAFANERLHLSRMYSTEQDLMNDPLLADVYCTGGDQMWNEQHNGHKTMREYYLTWAPKGKIRISLCTSVGKSQFDEWEKEEVRNLLSNYDLISVRENSGKKAIEKLGIKNVFHLQDPTILLNVEKWKSISAPRYIKEKYILLYEISRKAPLAEYAKNLAKKTGLKVLRINYYSCDALKYGKSVTAPTLEQFLSLFRYADYVITNSFHGTAFSVAFGRKFVAVAGANPSRLYNALEYYDMTERLCTKPAEVCDIINRPINYTEVNGRISNARKDFEDYMNKLMTLLDKREG